MINRILFIVLVVAAYSCSAPTKEVCIDNPTESDIIIHFDNNEPIQINAKEKKCVQLKFGTRTLHYNETQTELKLDGEKDYIINPTKSTYYIQNIPYVLSQKGKENYRNDYGSPSSVVEGFEMNGDFEEIKEKVLIAKNWTFGLDEEASESASTNYNPNTGYYIVRKIHRGSDLSATISKSFINQLEEALLEKSN
ncbi:MAG: hypothetical protein AAGA77_04825 [Bacteroidota bacterium]